MGEGGGHGTRCPGSWDSPKTQGLDSWALAPPAVNNVFLFLLLFLWDPTHAIVTFHRLAGPFAEAE